MAVAHYQHLLGVCMPDFFLDMGQYALKNLEKAPVAIPVLPRFLIDRRRKIQIVPPVLTAV